MLIPFSLASHVFVVDAAFAVVGWKVNRDRVRNTERERLLFSCNPLLLDWSGWGDWSFFFGSLLDAFISYLAGTPVKVQNYCALISDSLWTMNSILYTLGYCYGQDVRKRFANKYYTSLNHVAEDEFEVEEQKNYHNFSVEINQHTAVLIP